MHDKFLEHLVCCQVSIRIKNDQRSFVIALPCLLKFGVETRTPFQMDGEWYHVFYVALDFNTIKIEKRFREKTGQSSFLFDNLKAVCKEVLRGIYQHR